MEADRSSVLAQRAASEVPRWTRAVEDQSAPIPKEMMSKLGRIVCNLARRPQSKASHTLAWLGDELGESKHLCAQWEATPAASLNAGVGEEFRPRLVRLACPAIAEFLS